MIWQTSNCRRTLRRLMSRQRSDQRIAGSCTIFPFRLIDSRPGRGSMLRQPELAEVEWFRKQWDAGRGHEIDDVKAHSRKYVFRGTDGDALCRNLIGQKLLRSKRSGKQMLFEFSGENFLGIHLGMTGKTHVRSPDFQPANTIISFCINESAHWSSPILASSVTFVFITENRNRTGGGIVRRKSTRANLIVHSSTNSWIDIGKRRSKPAPHAKRLSGNWGTGWLTKSFGAQSLAIKTNPKLTVQSALRFSNNQMVVRRSLETLGKDFSDPPRNWLIHQKWKRNGICPIHRTPLKHATVAGRTTAWCPKCQK